MLARVITTQVDVNRLDEGIKIYEESVVPASKQQKGYVGQLLLGDRESGKAISITIWESEELATEGQKSGFLQEQIVKFAQIMVGAPEIEGLEVMVRAI